MARSPAEVESSRSPVAEPVLIVSAALALAAGAIIGGYPVWLQRVARKAIAERTRGNATAAASGAGLQACGPGDAARLPRVDVLVAVHQEGGGLAAKLENLARLQYPNDRLRLWIIDGASTDQSVEIARTYSRTDPRFRVLRHGCADKTAQLNAALRRLNGEWVLVTDADARLHPGTLLRLLAATTAPPWPNLVGATVRPAGAHWLEKAHWRWLNHLALRETAVASAAIVTAPCYLVRRDILRPWPADTVADDVHVALAARASGHRVAMVVADVVETRAPADVLSLIRHKFRKGSAYLREVVRFLPCVHRFRGTDRAIFLWRAAQVLCAPVLALLALLSAAVGFVTVGAGVTARILMLLVLGAFALGLARCAQMSAVADAPGGEGGLAQRAVAPVLLTMLLMGTLLAGAVACTLGRAPRGLRRLPQPLRVEGSLDVEGL